MSNGNYITVTRDLVKRGWSDFEPKVIAGLLTGSVAGFIVSLLGQYGIHLSPIQQNYIVIGCYFLGSYLTPSAGTTVTKTEDTSTGMHSESETHSGNAVSVVTNSTPIQRPTAVPDLPAAPEVAVSVSERPFWAGVSPSSGPTPIVDDQATRVLN